MESKIQCGSTFDCPDCDYRRSWGPGSSFTGLADFKAHRCQDHQAELTERTW